MEFTVADFLSASELDGIRLVAGHHGLDRTITRTNIIDNPDSLDWFMPGELVLSSGYLFQYQPHLQTEIIPALADINCAGLCIKTGRYFQTLPAPIIQQAQELDFPLIELPFGHSLSTAMDAVNRQLTMQGEHRLEKTLAIHREVMQTALTSTGLHNLTETLVRLIGNPVMVTDSNWNLLCHQDRGDNPYPLSSFVNTTPRRPPFTEEFLQTLPNSLRHYKKAVTRSYPVGGGANVRCRIRPIAAHDYIYGYIIVWETVRPMTELDFVAVEQVAVVAALERIRAKEVEQSKLRVRKDFLSDLLADNIGSVNAARSLAKLHGLPFDCPYRCLILREKQMPDTNQENFLSQLDAFSAAVTQGAREFGLRVVTVPQGVQLVVLIQLDNLAAEDTHTLRSALERMVALAQPFASDGGILAILGKSVSHLGQISHSFRDTQSGLQMALSAGMEDSVVITDDFAVYQLLSEQIDRDALRRFCQSSIGPLLNHDQKHGTQFTQTLDCYFAHNGSITDAARHMYIHRNTYIYRLEKIKALLGTDLRNPRKLLELQLGLMADHILKA